MALGSVHQTRMLAGVPQILTLTIVLIKLTLTLTIILCFPQSRFSLQQTSNMRASQYRPIGMSKRDFDRYWNPTKRVATGSMTAAAWIVTTVMMILTVAEAVNIKEEPVDSTVFFTEIGDTVSTRGDVHVRLYINITAMVEPMKEIRGGIRRATYKQYKKEHEILSDLARRDSSTDLKSVGTTTVGFNLTAATIDEYNRESGHPYSVMDDTNDHTMGQMIERLENYLDMGQVVEEPRPAKGPTGREKRFAFAPLLGMILPAVQTFLGAKNKFQIHQLSKQVAENSKDIRVLALNVENLGVAVSKTGGVVQRLNRMVGDVHLEMSHRLGRVEQQLLVNTHVASMSQLVNRAAQSVETLFQHRLAPSVLDKGQADVILQQLKTEAENAGYRLLLKNKADLFQCETSFIADKDGYEVFVHVPMAYEDDSLKVFKFIPIPAQLSTESAFQFKPEHDVIAMGPQNEYFQIMHMAELAQCTLKGSSYLCENANVVRSKEGALAAPEDPNNCLYFLMTRNYEAIKTSCPVDIRERQNGAFQVNENEFIFQNVKDETGTTTCANSLHSETWNGDERQQVNIPPGCWAETTTFRATATRNIPLSTWSVEYHWEEPLTDIIGTLDVEKYERLAKDAQDLTEVPHSLIGINSWIREETDSTLHKTFSWTAIGVSVMIVLLLVGMVGLGWWWSARIAARFDITIYRLFRILGRVTRDKIRARVAKHKERRARRQAKPRESDTEVDDSDSVSVQIDRPQATAPPMSKTTVARRTSGGRWRSTGTNRRTVLEPLRQEEAGRQLQRLEPEERRQLERLEPLQQEEASHQEQPQPQPPRQNLADMLLNANQAQA